jgi:hypothetical protein
MFDNDDVPATCPTETNVNNDSVSGCRYWKDTGNIDSVMECSTTRDRMFTPTVWGSFVD